MKKSVVGAIKKSLLVIVILFLASSVYCRFFIFSEDLAGNKINFMVNRFYSDQYLEKLGFQLQQQHLTWVLGYRQKNLFHLQFGETVITDSATIQLITTDYIKPYYVGYTLEVSPRIDSLIAVLLPSQPDSLDEYYIEKTGGGVYHTKNSFYHKTGIKNIKRLARFEEFDDGIPEPVKYWVNFQKRDESFTLLEKLFLTYVRLLNENI